MKTLCQQLSEVLDEDKKTEMDVDQLIKKGSPNEIKLFLNSMGGSFMEFFEEKYPDTHYAKTYIELHKKLSNFVFSAIEKK